MIRDRRVASPTLFGEACPTAKAMVAAIDQVSLEYDDD